MVHELKIDPQYFYAVVQGVKTFEVRKNDRPFEVGDYVLLKEYFLNGYTGNERMTKITYILNDAAYCKEGYVIFGIALLDK